VDKLKRKQAVGSRRLVVKTPYKLGYLYFSITETGRSFHLMDFINSGSLQAD
jgi:hypothetical protein